MKKLVLALVMIAGVASAQEFGYFSRTNNSASWSPASVSLNAGDQMIVLSCNNQDQFLSLTDRDGTEQAIYLRDLTAYFSSSGVGSYPMEARTLVGPAIISVRPDGTQSRATYLSYKIVRASDNSISPSNVISLPADVNGDMQLVFESSDDLLTWTPEYSFTHNSTNSGASSLEHA